MLLRVPDGGGVDRRLVLALRPERSVSRDDPVRTGTGIRGARAAGASPSQGRHLLVPEQIRRPDLNRFALAPCGKDHRFVPIGAIAMRRDLGTCFASDHKPRLGHGGTFNGNPLSITAPQIWPICEADGFRVTARDFAT